MSENEHNKYYRYQEAQLDHLHGLELLLEKIELKRSMLTLDKRLFTEDHAMVKEAYTADILRLQVKIQALKKELTTQSFEQWKLNWISEPQQ